MKIALRFELTGIDSLADVIAVGIVGYAVEGLQMGRLRSLYLFLCDDTKLRVQSSVTTVGPWHEVGKLVFQRPMMNEAIPAMVHVGPAWSEIDFVEKLVLEEETFSAECGVLIVNRAGEEFRILSGALPHTVEVAASFYSGDFQPEYDVDAYRHVSA